MAAKRPRLSVVRSEARAITVRAAPSASVFVPARSWSATVTLEVTGACLVCEARAAALPPVPVAPAGHGLPARPPIRPELGFGAP